MDKNLMNLTKADLLEKAKKLKIKTSASMKKEAIAKAIGKATAAKVAKPLARKKPAKATPAKVAKPLARKKPAKATPAKVAKPLAKKKAVKVTAKVAKPLAKKKPAKATAVKVVKPSVGNRAKWDIVVDENKFFIAQENREYEQAQGATPPPSPDAGETRIVAMVKDETVVYVYWETDYNTAENAREALGIEWRYIQWVVRVYDMTTDKLLDQSTAKYIDILINSSGRNIDIPTQSPGADYIFALGIKSRDGRFEQVAISTRISTPQAGVAPSGYTSGDWDVPDEVFAKLYKLSGGIGASSMGGSDKFAGEIASLEFGASEEIMNRRKFFFELDCRLTVFGRTEPDATVTIGGKPIVLSPEGEFSLQLKLPDGVFHIPVVATSNGKVEQREISPTVTRTTYNKNR